MAVSHKGWLCTNCQSNAHWEPTPGYFPANVVCINCNTYHVNFDDCLCNANNWGNFNAVTAQCLSCGYFKRIKDMNTNSIIPYVHVPVLGPEPVTPVILNRCIACGMDLCPELDAYYGFSDTEAKKCAKCRF